MMGKHINSGIFRIAFALLLGCVFAVAGFQVAAQSTMPSGGSTPVRSDLEKQAYGKAMEEADSKILSEVSSHSELIKNLEYLTTQIGPRLTGSPQMQAASEWTLQRFREYGLDAHLETAQIPFAWQRGNESAEIVSPISRPIEIHSVGWGKAIPSAISGSIVLIDLRSLNDLEKYKGKLKGKIVLINKPVELPKFGQVADNSYDAMSSPPREQLEVLRSAAKVLAQEEVAAIVLDSAKPFALFNMTSSYLAGNTDGYHPSAVPMGFITHDDYALLYRLASQGPVTLRIRMESTFSSGPVPVSITVAEIKGKELPEERVVLGGHLDSWDLGQGALDNGTGAMAVMEAALALKKLGWAPKRTITFILFTGEEEGGTGATQFLKNHVSEIPKMDAALIEDNGTGRVISIPLEGLWETAPIMTEIYQPLQKVFGLLPLDTRYYGSSDHIFFLRKGVPAYPCLQTVAQYGEAHHSQADTFELVIPDEINQVSAVLAAWAWNVSEMPVPLPHHLPEK